MPAFDFSQKETQNSTHFYAKRAGSYTSFGKLSAIDAGTLPERGDLVVEAVDSEVMSTILRTLPAVDVRSQARRSTKSFQVRDDRGMEEWEAEKLRIGRQRLGERGISRGTSALPKQTSGSLTPPNFGSRTASECSKDRTRHQRCLGSLVKNLLPVMLPP